MKPHRLLPIALIALAGLSLGSGCPTFPKLEDRIIELAVGGTTTLEFTGQSNVSTAWSSTETYNLASAIDLKKLVDAAGIDVHEVTDIKLAGVSYRVSAANAGPRTISNGTVTVDRGTGTPVTMVSNFSQAVGATTPFITAPLSAPGVAILNQLLADILAAAKSGGTVTNPEVSYTASGTADGVPYNFKWQLKLDVTIVGKVKGIKVLT